jgi:hypothetical protein
MIFFNIAFTAVVFLVVASIFISTAPRDFGGSTGKSKPIIAWQLFVTALFFLSFVVMIAGAATGLISLIWGFF